MQFTQLTVFYLTILALPLALAALAWWAAWQRQQDLKKVGDPQLLNQMLRHLSPTRRGLRGAAFMLGLFLLGLALAGPQYGVKMVEVSRQGLDVIIALDVSRSMLAEDIEPNRLARAQQELAALIDSLRGDRVGVIAFAGSAHVACPLTTDYAAAKMFLKYLTPNSVPTAGTALGQAIRRAVSIFPEGGEGYRVLVLLTDGEDHDSQALAAAEAAKAAGVKILSIGFGTPAGEPIPVRGASGQVSGYLKDSQGRTVVSRLDEATLQKITQITGGAYWPAHQGGLEADALARLIGRMQKRDVSAGQYGAQENRYQFVLVPALLVLLLGFWLPLRRRAWLLLLPWLILVANPASADTAGAVNQGNRDYKKGKYEEALKKYQDAKIKNPREPIVDYNMGNAYHQLEQAEDAEKAYERVLKGKKRALQARTWYNLGNTYFQQQKYQEAIAAYRQALKIKPRDQDTIYNLAQALYLLKNPQAAQQHKKEQEEKSQQQQQQQSSGKSDQDPAKASGQKSADPQKGPDDRGETKAKDGETQDTPEEAKPARPRPGEMSKQEAENILDAVRESEQAAREAQKEKMPNPVREKGRPDW